MITALAWLLVVGILLAPLAFFGCCCGPTPCSETHTVCVHVIDCDGTSGASGVSVSITGPGGYSSSGTTDGSGDYCGANWTYLGVYTITVDSLAPITSNFTTCTNKSFNVCIGTAQLCVTISYPCDGDASEVTVTYTQGGVTVASGTPDAGGSFCACVPPGIDTTITATTSGSLIDDPTGILVLASNLSACESYNAGTMTFTVEDGYDCLCSPGGGSPCHLPLSDTVYVSDPYLGVSGLALTNPGGTTQWTGSTSITGAYCGCANTTFTVTYTLGTLTPILGGATCGLEVTYTGSGVLDCPGGGSTLVGAQRVLTISACPEDGGFAATITLDGFNVARGNNSLYCAGLTGPLTITVAE